MTSVVDAHKQLISEHLAAAGPTVVGVRGSLLASSIETLRELGLFEAYRAKLDPSYAEAILYGVASSWLPVEVAMAHYAACDALALSDADLARIGEAVSTRIMGTFLGTMLRSSRSVGAAPSPWVPIKQYGRVCERLMNGGRYVVYEAGPKDAVLEAHGIPMLAYRYFRSAQVGMTRGAAGVFAKTCFAKELHMLGADRIRISVRWV